MTYSAGHQLALLLAIVMQCETSTVLAQPTNQAVFRDFVPPDYSVVLQNEADLNGDGLPDLLLVLKKIGESDTPRPLVVLFQERAGQYALSIRTDKAIPESGSGGVASTDGFDGIKMTRNGFVISQFGGSSVRHSFDWKFRYQDGDWYLIGETELIGGPGVSCPPIKRRKAPPCGAYKMDTNFLTRKQIGTVYFDEGTYTVRRTTPKRDLIRLADFYPEAWSGFQW